MTQLNRYENDDHRRRHGGFNGSGRGSAPGFLCILLGDRGRLAIIAVVTAIAVPASPAAGPDDGPVAAFSFVEGEGTTAEDVTGDGHGLGCLFETQIGENRLNPDT